MKTYLDHEFWKRIGILMQSSDEEIDQESLLNFKRFLKNETDLFLNIPADSLIELPIYNDLTSGRGKYAKLSVKPESFRFMNGPLLFQNLFEDPDNLFLLEPKDVGLLQKWREKNGFLICDHKSLLTSWLIYRQLDTTRYPRSFSVRPDSKFEFNLTSFAGLSIYRHPVTDCILSDRFLFTKEDLLTSNLSGLLESLLEIRPNINLSLFGSKTQTFETNPDNLKKVCLKCLSKFPDIKIEVILDDTDRFKEHDRHFITNYFHFKPGGSFSFFDSTNKLRTKGTSIDIKSLFDFSEMEGAKNTIKNLSQIKVSSSTRSVGIKRNRLFNLIQ